ncbi:hypothetical protein HYS31_00050 [Candidatus Woesearchaeota archaeon]|nr:hypothetical protein [Candidatus Woesearchaeota archaeon]
MNKKGELVLISIVVAILVLTSFAILKEKIDQDRIIHYVGDISTKTAYNLESKNINCDLNKIIILKNNIILFEDYNKVKLEGFKVDQNCN